MKNIHIVISGNGDGSSSLCWFKETSLDTLKNLDEITGDYERWSSGDGVQIKTLSFPDDFNLDLLGLADWEWDDELLEEYV